MDVLTKIGVDLSTLDHESVFQDVVRHVNNQPLPSRSKEDGANDDWINNTEYSHSNRLRQVVGRQIGQLATKETVTDADRLELRIILASAKDRYVTSLDEMVQTHPVLREKIAIDYERKHLIRDGHIMALDGETKMSAMTERGYKKAKKDAAKDSRMQPLAERCDADRRWMERAEQLPQGSMLFGVSVYTNGAGQEFFRDLGWREGLSFIQWVYKLDGDTAVYGSYSIDPATAELIRRSWQQDTGIEIPGGEITDTWLDHSTTMQGTLEDCRNKIIALRSLVYHNAGDYRKRYSMEKILAVNQQAGDEIFNNLYIPLIIAEETHRKDEIMQAFVKSLLDDPGAIDEKIYWQLLDIYNRDTLDSKDTSLIEQLIRYAAAEHFCEGLANLESLEIAQTAAYKPVVRTFVPVDVRTLNHMAHSLALKVLKGARNGDTFGGCTRSIKLSNNKKSGSSGGGEVSDGSDEDYLSGSSQENGSTDGETSNQVCDYVNPYCYCCPYNDDGTVRATPKAPRARRDTSGKASCLRAACGAAIDAKGKVISKGKVYERAQLLELAQRKLKPLAINGLAQTIADSKKASTKTSQT